MKPRWSHCLLAASLSVASIAEAQPVPGAAAQPSTPAQTPPAPAQTPAAPAVEGPRTAVIDIAPLGVEPVVGTHLTDLVRTTVTALGFRVVPTQELYAAAQRLSLPFPVPPDGVFLLERALQAPVAITGEARASGGQYVVRLRVRVAVEAQERTREVTGDQWTLDENVRAALPALLVPPEVPSAQRTTPPPTSVTPPPTTRPPRIRRVRAHARRWELGGGVFTAFGPGRDSFVNASVFARVGFFPQDRLGFTFSAGYANLRGRGQRVSNALFLLGVETAVDLVPSKRVFIPLRAEFGYLPDNGPVIRLSAGVAFQLARRVRLSFDILSPTLWVLPETAPVSLDLAASIHIGL